MAGFRSRIRTRTPGTVTGGGEVVVIAGDTDALIDIGTDTQAQDEVNGQMDGQDLGTDTQGMPSDEMLGDFTAPLGTDTQGADDGDIEVSGDGTRDLGTDSQSQNEVLGVLGGQDLGTDSASMAASSTGTAGANPATGTRVDIGASGGSTTWASPGNAIDINLGNAQITDAGETLAAVDYSDELRLTFAAIPSLPSGYVATSALLRIVHGWQTLNPALDVLSTNSFVLIMRYTDGTEDVLKTLTEASADQAGVGANETYDITARYITQGKTPERLMFQATAAIAILQTGTTKAWRVDVGRIEISYTRSGIT